MMRMRAVLIWAYIASSLETRRRRITAGRSRPRSLLHAVTRDGGICRGGATKEVPRESLKHTKKSQLLDGGTSSPSLSIRFKDCLDRLVRFARRIYQRWSRPAIAKNVKTTGHKNATASTQQVARAPSTMASRKAARIAKELKEFLAHPPENCKVSMGKNLNVWIVTITGANKTIFEGEKYKLRVAFPADYPTSPPSVYFLQPPPRHPHVRYTSNWQSRFQARSRRRCIPTATSASICLVRTGDPTYPLPSSRYPFSRCSHQPNKKAFHRTTLCTLRHPQAARRKAGCITTTRAKSPRAFQILAAQNIRPSSFFLRKESSCGLGVSSINKTLFRSIHTLCGSEPGSGLCPPF